MYKAGTVDCITENTMLAAVKQPRSRQELQVILDLQGSLPIKKYVIQAAITNVLNSYPLLLKLLLSQQSESFLAKL
jgi:hypothetical protein